ncbi:MAG TPA: Ig-like domain-containing protein, partial [Methylomirabilota bacterium]|nr:Ig-like domain-containing protein [Methylomirabilota bacterium]
MGGGGDPNQFNSRYKNYLGWITNTDITTIPSVGLNRYRLYCFDLDYSVGLRGLRFVRGSDNYWLNFRQRKTTKAALMNGVQLLWTGNGNQGSYLLDVRLKGDADNNAVVIGRTFTDTNLNFHFTPIGKGNTYPQSIDVVAATGPQPGNLPPLASLAASTLAPNPGQAVAFTATASDPNGDTLAYYWQFGDGAESYSSDNKPTQTRSFTTAGEYAVRCVVSDMRGGTAEHTLVVRVGNPSVFRISGHVMDVYGKPVVGAFISAGSRTVAVNSDGSYTIPGLAAGSYNVSAREPVYGTIEFTHPFFGNPVVLGPNAQNIDFVVGTSAPPVTLVAAGAVWKYFDKGIDPGAGWQNPSFGDLTWSNGPSPLGYGEGDEATVISFGPSSANKYPAYYFRTSFNIANPAALTNTVLNVRRDDGAIVYLNGIQVFRNNMPAGPVTHTTFAAANAGDDGETWFATNVSSSLLIAGVNVLAAEVHQDSPGSSDVTFDLTFNAESTANIPRGALVYINSPADNAVFASPANINVVAGAYSTPATVTSVEIYDGATQLGVAASPPYSALLTSPSPGLHTLRAVSVDSGGIRRTSAPVNITVTAPAPRNCIVTSPANGSSFSLPVNVALTAEASAGGALTVTNVQFYSNGLLIGQDATSPFSLVWSNPPTGAHLLVAVAHDSTGASITSAPVNITVSATPAGDALISFGDVWKYSDDGANLGTGWTGSAYNDNQWSMGPGRLGYGGDGEITAVSYGTNINFKYVTTYFRKKFVVANPAAFSSLLMQIIRDDGVAVYINNVEVYRTNLLAGPISYNSLALTAIGGADETTPLNVPLSAAHLVAGTNTIAVEMHQDSITSTDLGFDLALIGLHDTNITDGLYITAPADGTHYNMPANVSLAAYGSTSSGAITLVEYFDGPTKVGQASSAPYAANWSGAVEGAHVLTAVATVSGGMAMTSPPVSIVVGPAPASVAPVFRPIILYGAQWRYWDSAIPVSNGWRDIGYDDSAWASGNGRFGWGLDGESTLLTEGRVTHYFRRTFVLNTANTVDSLTFNVLRDDGVVVYLNGIE